MRIIEKIFKQDNGQKQYPLTYESLLEQIISKYPVTFIRIGDGEINAMFGHPAKKTENCDNHTYFADLGKSLINVLKKKPDYHIGMQSLAMRIRKKEIDYFKTKNKLDKLKWFNADILHHASIKGLIKPFFNAVNYRKNIVLVGPQFLSKIKSYINYDYHVVIPGLNCWESYKQILYDCSKIVNRIINRPVNNGDVLFLISASMPAKVLIDDLYCQYNDKLNISLLDTGSLFDPFCGKNSRGYHRDLDIVKLNGF